MTAVVQPDTGEITVLMTKDEAEDCTLKIKQYAGMLCHLVREAHDKQAWKAMGYGSWAAYCKAEFDYSRSYSYRLIGHVNRILELSAAAGIDADVSPMGDTLTERATRDLDVPAAVEAVEEATADLPDDASNEDRLDAAMEAIAAQQTKAKAEAEPSPAVLAARARREAEEAAQSSGSDGSIPDDASDPDPSPEQNAPEPRTARNDDAAPATGGKVGSPPDLPAPELPEDWRKRLADSLHLLGLDPALVAAHATDDDRIELADLAVWIEKFHQATEANQEAPT